MKTILTDDERREIHRKAALAPSAVDALIAETEAAVLAKLREQEPVAVVSSVTEPGERGVRVKWIGGFPQIGTKLYAAPQAPQAEQAAELPRGECFSNGNICARCGHDEFIEAPQDEQAAEPVREPLTFSVVSVGGGGAPARYVGDEQAAEPVREASWQTGLGLAAIGHRHFGNPIPQQWYAAARELIDRAALASTERQQAEQAAEPVVDELAALEAWENSYALTAEPNYSQATRADCWAAFRAGAAPASTERQPPAQWQEAVNPPSERGVFLVRIGDQTHLAQFDPRMASAKWCHPYGLPARMVHKPSHWMPLPAPPAHGIGGKEQG